MPPNAIELSSGHSFVREAVKAISPLRKWLRQVEPDSIFYRYGVSFTLYGVNGFQLTIEAGDPKYGVTQDQANKVIQKYEELYNEAKRKFLEGDYRDLDVPRQLPTE